MEFSDKLRKAIRVLQRKDPNFSGTATAVAQRCGLSTHSQIVNLLDGVTQPWNVRVETMESLCRELGMKPEDFYPPA